MLEESKAAAGLPGAGDIGATPFDVETDRRNLEINVYVVDRQDVIPRRFEVDELFDDLARTLAA